MLSIRVIPDGPTRALQVRIALTKPCLFLPVPMVSQYLLSVLMLDVGYAVLCKKELGLHYRVVWK